MCIFKQCNHFHQGTFTLVLSMWQNLDFPILADAKADPGDVEVAINRPSGGKKKKVLVFTGNGLLILFF